MSRVRLLQGNEACAEGALYAGCNFFAGYPITPSTEVAEHMAKTLPRKGGVFLQMEDEIAAMAAVIGGSLTGCKALTATSGPGFSLKQENMGFAMLTEVPCVIVNVMRGGPSTGVPTGPGQSDIMQCKWGTHGDHPVICLTPAYVQEIFSETVRAFNLSEKYRTPVIIAFDEIVGHMRERIEIPGPGALPVVGRPRPTCPPAEYLPYDDRKDDVPPMANFFEGYRFHVTGLNHGPDGFPVNASPRIHTDELRLLRKVESNRGDIVKYATHRLEDAEVAIFAYGVCGRSAKTAVDAARSEGIKAGLFRPLTIWPFPEEQVAALSGRVARIIVPELSLGQIVHEVDRCAKGRCEVEGIYRVDGDPITPAQIVARIKEAR
ncbi:MAG: 2-oxoglutarate ferredoxin oxidoreductase subunit alpha [Deltaproteobacteria bacterium]|nr:2-oxoglutarate ferredoxin oxidoreductase subunit alpha [Deltaproteobacteria bacterium]